MITADRNDRMTLTGAGTPAGALMRRYWHPVALSDELAGERPLRPVRLMGQDFVLFRDQAGRLGLLDRDCPHRGADLAYGRLEDGGLRCLFHGWLFDVAGTCLQTPAEPPTSRVCQHVRQKSYPVQERNGMIFAYIGEGEAPAFPAFDCFAAPDSHVFAFKGLIECNWLQALEVGIDPAHASFLHRFFEDEDPDSAYGKQFRATSTDSDLTMTQVLRQFDCPDLEVESTDYGMRLFALRHLGEGRTHVRVTNMIFPHGFVIPLSPEMTITQWHVPVDDRSCYWYAYFTSFSGPVDKQQMRDQRLELYELPDYRSRRNRGNAYGYDPAEQRTQTYTGMGEDINVHDQWAVESQGRIQDRTREHLATTDKGIVMYRRLLMKAIRDVEEGSAPLMALPEDAARAITGPATIDLVAASADWQAAWRAGEARKRARCSWIAGEPALAQAS
ncbi:MAG: aromatic ring-hydroxylating dioxygenase subunit alpha [Sneathiellaceae bacterium]